MVTFVVIIIHIGLSILVTYKSGKHKRIGFTATLILSLALSPFVGFLFAENSALDSPRGCNWCGNHENEAEYCGLCLKNAYGEIRPSGKLKK